jgi:hypothetical protein
MPISRSAASRTGAKYKLSCNLTVVGTKDMDDEQINALGLPEDISVQVVNKETGGVIMEGETHYAFAKSGNVNYFVGGNKPL